MKIMVHYYSTINFVVAYYCTILNHGTANTYHWNHGTPLWHQQASCRFFYQCSIKVVVHNEATIKIGAQKERTINAMAA
jgi:hypothetical protein